MRCAKNKLKTILWIGIVLLNIICCPMISKAAKDISSGDVKCTKDGGTYEVTGSTGKNRIYVDGKNIKLYLTNVTIDLLDEEDDGKSKEKSAIHIEKGSTVTIYLKGNNRLEGGNNTGIGKNYGYAGICVEDGASLTILGNGKLTVKGGGVQYGAAAIGSNYDENCGKITIGDSKNCPVITATGGCSGAGIGSGRDGICNDGIYINNGDITATGGKYAAGIGGGDAIGTGSGGKCDTIEITGGTVVAKGGTYAAGIGGSEDGDAYNITISGGNVTATGGTSGAGIGGGKEGYTENITISGGTITAKGGQYGAGIGGGNRVLAGNGGNVNNIKITGGIINATGGESGAGIGGGDQSEVSGLKISQESGSTLEITATGGKWGAGIGNANSGTISHNISSVYIYLRGGTITATGGNEGAGIGGGNSTANKIEIYGWGKVTATGYNESSGIGSGENEDGGDITIEGVGSGRPLTINANAFAKDGRTNDAAAIGSASSKCGNITIKNAIVSIDSRYDSDGAGIGTGFKTDMAKKEGKDITIENCKVYDRGQSTRRGAGIGAGTSCSVNNIYIKNSDIEVGSIGLSFNGNEVFIESCLNSLVIEGSTVKADSRVGQRAAIGSGAFSSVKLIEIKGSKVEAKSINGAGIGSGGYSSDRSSDFMFWTGGECGEIKISGSVVKAIGGEGGAGIGGGWGTSVGAITITASDVTAAGGVRGKYRGGAGIGGGAQESCGLITITDSKVKATGEVCAAGIGSGGSESISSLLWNITCGGIEITGSNVEAIGGSDGAGIGTGYGAQFTGGAYITITDSTVKANGGDYGAGIGAGSGGSLDRGGEASIDINIKGKSKVEATGGKGAAGIGGGFEGGADTVNIELTDTIRMSSGEWMYYVKAIGGAGAAGIGSGGIDTDEVTFPKSGFDISCVRITNGYVYAKGGDRDDKLGKGAGAGIGGGARGGNINGFYVSGGYVHANAGAGSGDFAANDIGTGGNDVRGLFEDESFYITGGTVIGRLSGDPNKIYIDGGSVSHNTDKAVRTDGTKVYRTQMKVDYPYSEIYYLSTAVKDYGCNDIISDGYSKVYLYLPKNDNNSNAYFVIAGKDRHYYGKVKESGSSWLKMDARLDIILLDTPVAGKTFRAKLKNSNVDSDIKYVASGTAKLMENGSATDSPIILPGTDEITLYGTDFGTFTINAQATKESEMYWSASGSYTGKITKSATTLAVVTDPSKVYDGKPIINPEIKTNSNGEITYTYYDGGISENNKMNTMPTKAGFYTLVVNVAGTDKYEAAKVTKTFNIEQRPITLVMSASQTGNKGVVTVEALNAVDVDGAIDLDIVKDGGGFVSRQISLTKDSNGKFIASIEFDKVNSSNYNVTAEYIDGTNHFCRASVSRMFSKDKAIRTVSHADIEVTYGENPVVLSPTPSHTSTEGDYYEYRIVEGSDEFVTYGLAPTVILDSTTGEVVFNRAGKAVIEIVLRERDDLGNGVEYEDAYTYVTVTVNKKDITATPVIRDANSSTLTTIEYGKTDTLIYDIVYEGLVGLDIFHDSAVGTLEVEKLEKTASVGTYSVGIKKVGGTISLKGTNYDNIFISRNYNVTVVPAQITVTPIEITVSAADTEVKYGQDKPQLQYIVEGLMEWDEDKEIFEVHPAVSLDESVTGASYEGLNPGLYENSLYISNAGTIKNNEHSTQNYIIRIGERGDLNVDKADIYVKTESEIAIYNGNPVNAVAVVDSMDELNYDGNVELKYYEITEEGLAEIEGAPVNVGIYMVEALGEETGCYYGANSRSMIVIEQAVPNVDIPKLPDMKMHDGLILEEQTLPEGWAWCYPDKELSVGYVSSLAVYTPQDTHNYKTVEAYLDFEVYDETPDIPDEDDDMDDGDNKDDEEPEEEDSNSGDYKDDDDDSDDENLDDDSDEEKSDIENSDDESDGEKDENVVDTGDTFNPVIWGCIFGVSGLVLICSIISHFKRKK